MWDPERFIITEMLTLFAHATIYSLRNVLCARQTGGYAGNVQSASPTSTFVNVSGGRHATALTVDGKVFSWGEGDDGKLGHFSRM